MMCLKSFNLPGVLGLEFLFHNSLLWPPFQFLVVKPKISTLTEHLSSVLDNISAQIAAIVINKSSELINHLIHHLMLILAQN